MELQKVSIVIFLLRGFATGQTDYDYGTEYYVSQISGEVISLSPENSSDTAYEDQEDESDITPMDTAVVILYSFIIFVGLIANSVVLFVIFAGHEVGKTVTTIYILMLTTADSVFLITLPIFTVQKMSSSWNFGEAMCTICQTIKFLNYYAGIFFLTAMSIDRYIAIAYSTRLTQIRTKRQTGLLCSIVWIMSILMSIPIMLYAKIEQGHGVAFCRVIFPGYKFLNETQSTFFTIDYYEFEPSDSEDIDVAYSMPFDDNSTVNNEDLYQHTCDFGLQPQSYKMWLVANFIISFVIPFYVIVAMYALILLRLRKAEQKVGQKGTSRSARTRKRVTKMVAALVVCFTICWLPHHILLLARIPGFASTVASCTGLEEFFSALAFSNSALNPILYTFLGNNFRERFRKSIRNARSTVRKRMSVNGSGMRRSVKSTSGEISRRKNASIMIYHRSSSAGSTDSSSNGKRKKSQASVIRLKLDKFHSDRQSTDKS